MNETKDLSADIHFPGLLVGHYSLGGGNDGNPQAIQYAGQFTGTGISP
jgi:hypothetical protein